MKRTIQGVPLTPRQIEILRLIAQDLTDAEIALKIGVSRFTIGAHLRDIDKVLGMRRRVALTVYALKNGLVRLDDIDLPVRPAMKSKIARGTAQKGKE